MADDVMQRAHDAEEHLKTYRTIMKVSGEVGVPACLGITMFVTNLLLDHGMFLSLVAGVLTYILVHYVVRAFFSH
ncbi:MAG: hypothetical protein GC153_08680 [Alphaproteobacteria bacterium]|nr:hypothetical protein [Alphaproteobacteria bacterium]